MNAVHRLMTVHHEYLARWLSDGRRADLDAFLNVHHPGFSLVTTDGEILGLDALRSGLSGSGGSRPGLSIAISGLTRLGPETHRFLEQHVMGSEAVDARIVTCVLRGEHVIALQETTRPLGHSCSGDEPPGAGSRPFSGPWFSAADPTRRA
ncbi:hypothetical protein [Kocuria palustris]|uniref:hypothetical protein n=1 Tax=Kocuria palustris TaxID=71999 RepID=UPI001642D880|nr:hypothetical protein [Kocuria palustris]